MNALRADFWSWSLYRYEADGVAPRLLEMQDFFGLDVNILLWCGWCAEGYREIPDLVLKKAVDLTTPWARDVTQSLRTARNILKSPPKHADADSSSALLARVKEAELMAEEIEQKMLEALARAALLPSDCNSNPLARLRHNLVNYCAIVGAQRQPRFSVALLDDLARLLLPEAAARELEMTEDAR